MTPDCEAPTKKGQIVNFPRHLAPRLWLCLCLCLAASMVDVAMASDPEPRARLAILEVRSTGEGAEEVAEQVGLLLESWVHDTATYDIVNQDRVAERLKELARQQSDLYDPDSAVEVGMALGAENLLAATVSRVDRTYVVSLKLIVIEENLEVFNQAVQCECAPQDVYPEVQALVWRMAGKPLPEDGVVDRAAQTPKVLDLLERWRANYEALDFPALRRIWPSCPWTKKQFASVKSLQIEIPPEETEILLSGRLAIVKSTIKIRGYRAGGKDPDEYRAEFRFMREGGDWFIDDYKVKR